MTYEGASPGPGDQRTDQIAANTQELFELLEQAAQLEPFLEEYGSSMNAPTFAQYLTDLLKQRELTTTRLSELSLLSRSFTYQLCSGIRVPGRDIVLRLAIVLNLRVEECQQMLRSAQRGVLYPRVRRDAVVIFALSRQLSISDTDEMLRALGEDPLL